MIPTGTWRAFCEIPSEEVADGREVLHRLGRADAPLAFDGRERRQRFLLRHAEMADLRVVCGGDFLFPVDDRLLSDAQAELPLHVRLAACHPDLAHEDVVEDDLVRPRNRQRERAAGLERRQVRQPFAVGASRAGTDCLAISTVTVSPEPPYPRQAPCAPCCSTAWSAKSGLG